MIRSLDVKAFKAAVKIEMIISENLSIIYLKDIGFPAENYAIRYFIFKNGYTFGQFLSVMSSANDIKFYDEDDNIIEHECEIIVVVLKDPFLDFEGDTLTTIPIYGNTKPYINLCEEETDQYDYGKTTRDFINSKMAGRGKGKRRC